MFYSNAQLSHRQLEFRSDVDIILSELSYIKEKKRTVKEFRDTRKETVKYHR